MADVNKKTQGISFNKTTPLRNYRVIYDEWKVSRINKWCRRCIHSCRIIEGNSFCQWFGKTCKEAVWYDCPIPNSLLNEDPGDNTCMVDNSQRNDQSEKGGTIVPPSKFHFVSTEKTESQSVMGKSPRPHGPARAHAGEKPQAPTQISHQKCEETDCPFYGLLCDYCQICSYNIESLLRQKPVMCERLINGSCDGHACCCDNFRPFNPDGE